MTDWKEAYGDLDGLRHALQMPRPLIIQFKKVNGDIRVMLCTLNAPFINKYTTPSKTKAESTDPFAEERKAKLAETNLAVFDVEKREWRSMIVANIQSVTTTTIEL